MTWEQDIARKQRELAESTGSSKLPNDPDTELNEMMSAIQAPPQVADQLRGEAPASPPDMDETLGLDQMMQERAERMGKTAPAPARPPKKRGISMKSRQDAQQEEPAAQAPPAPGPTPEVQEAPPQPPPRVAEEQGEISDPLDYIANLPGGPSRSELQQLKRAYGDIYFLPLEGDTVFVFRYLNNFEWEKEIMVQPQLAQNREALQHAVLNRCVLWPKLTPEYSNTRQAGLPSLLFEVIMKASYFIEPADALMMVQKI